METKSTQCGVPKSESPADAFLRKVRDQAQAPNVVNGEEPCLMPFGVLVKVYDPTNPEGQTYVCLSLNTGKYTPAAPPQRAQPHITLTIDRGGVRCDTAEGSNANPDASSDEGAATALSRWARTNPPRTVLLSSNATSTQTRIPRCDATMTSLCKLCHRHATAPQAGELRDGAIVAEEGRSGQVWRWVRS